MYTKNIVHPLTLNSFRPFGNNWKEDVEGTRFTREEIAESSKNYEDKSCVALFCRFLEPGVGMPKYIIDSSTGDKYVNLPKKTIRIILGCVLLVSTILSPVIVIVRVVQTIFHIVSFYHFRATKSFSIGLRNTAIESTQAIFKPIHLVAVVCICTYGQFFPKDGMKLLRSSKRLFN